MIIYMKKNMLIRGWLLLLSTASLLNGANNSAQIPPSLLPASKAAHQTSSLNTDPFYKEGEVIVKFKKNIRASQIQAAISTSDIHIANSFPILSRAKASPYMLVKSKKLSTQALLKQFKADPNVAYVEPNYLYHTQEVPNDPKFDQLWGLLNTGQSVSGTAGTAGADIKAAEAWDVSTGSSNVVIAVIDTGVDYLHEDLKANMWENPHEIPGNGIDDDNNSYVDDVYGIDAANNTGDPMDLIAEEGGHGTHVAGTIAATGNNGKGIAGVSWHTRIMALKFLSSNGGTTEDAIECLEYVIEQKQKGVNIVATNNSWGGGGFSQALHDTIKATTDLGILFIAAAGNKENDNDANAYYPASYDLDGIITVAATDQDDVLITKENHYYGSNYGATSVDLAAPGINIFSSTPRQHMPKSSDIFFDDMENGLENWVTGGTNNHWTISDNQEIFDNTQFPVPSPTHFLSDSAGGVYDNNTDAWILLKSSLDLSSYTTGDHIYVAFGSAMDIEASYDHATVEVSGDNSQHWTTLFDCSGYGYYWQITYAFEIPDSVKTSQFTLRFHITTDDSVQHYGWLIDNVGIGTGVDSLYGYKGGTSMATPHVTGAAAVLASLFTNDDMATRKSRIMDSVDLLESLNGKVLSGGRLNLKKAIDTGAATICPDRQHHIQGSNVCVPGTREDIVPLPPSPCSDGKRLLQGTHTCIEAGAVTPPGLFLSRDTNGTCPSGEKPVQGSMTACAPISP